MGVRGKEGLFRARKHIGNFKCDALHIGMSDGCKSVGYELVLAAGTGGRSMWRDARSKKYESCTNMGQNVFEKQFTSNTIVFLGPDYV